MTCKKKNEYWLLNTTGYFEDYKDYDESKEKEIFRRPIERKFNLYPRIQCCDLTQKIFRQTSNSKTLL